MIEVEKKFQPTEDQLSLMLIGATFQNEKNIHDIYFDFEDFRIFKSGKRLRKRDSGFELKVYHDDGEESVAIADEYIDENKIIEILDLQIFGKELMDIVAQNMQIVCDFETFRKKYKKDIFIIDVDKTSFGFDVVEIEVLVQDVHEIADAEQKIIAFAQKFNLSPENLPQKTKKYLEIVRPEIYAQIF